MLIVAFCDFCAILWPLVLSVFGQFDKPIALVQAAGGRVGLDDIQRKCIKLQAMGMRRGPIQQLRSQAPALMVW